VGRPGLGLLAGSPTTGPTGGSGGSGSSGPHDGAATAAAMVMAMVAVAVGVGWFRLSVLRARTSVS
jgi:hypothetical protein